MSNSQQLSQDLIQGFQNTSTTKQQADAISVAILYGLLGFAALFNFFRDRHGSHWILVFFGAIRTAAFSIRAYLQTHLEENLLIAYQVLLAVGFIAIVKLVYSLLFAWTLPDSKQLSQANRNRRSGVRALLPVLMRSHGTMQESLVFAALLAGVICNIIGATRAYGDNVSQHDYTSGLRLLKAGYTIFLVVIGVFDILCITQPFVVYGPDGRPAAFRRSATKMSLMSGSLLVVGLLLSTKSVFQVIAIYKNPILQYRNHLFYPLEVLPELLTMLILVIPGFMDKYLGYHRQSDQVQDPGYPAGARQNGNAINEQSPDAANKV